MSSTTRPKRSRVPPSPKPILDRQALIKALDAANISLKAGQLDLFYKLLHRQHYPKLSSFVETYYKNEQGRDENTPPQLPLKNPVSKRNQNGKQRLPRKFLDFLKDPDNDFETVTSQILTAQTSADGSTTKLAIQLHDDHIVEAVIMRFTNKGGSRATLCVSSQVGCAMGCTFCATGTMGIRGNLNCGEILEQLVHAGRILTEEASDSQNNNDKDDDKAKNKPELVRNVVFMGMGEPLNNYNNVIQACRALIDCKRWNLAHGRVTVSTVGVISKMQNLTRDLPEVSLALSLHAPNQEMRSAIVPAAKHYPIEGLIEALDAHMMAKCKTRGAKDRVQASKRKRAMIEYVMLEGDTSSFECAHQLGKLCENRHLVVNLIPYNQTDVKDKLRCPSDGHMKEFHRIVCSYGAFCTIRRTMGADITGACGQLVVQREKKEDNVKDIEDGPFERAQSAIGRHGMDLARKSADGSEESLMSSKKFNGAHDRDTNDAIVEAFGKDASLTKWIQPLAVATSVAASCFLVSTVLFLRQRHQR